jgi:glycosyltransferase involved in cell wall biosynthesis
MNIWYISKYASDPIYGYPGRHYSYAKYFVKKGEKVTLISSRSNGKVKTPSFGLKNQFYYQSDGVNGVILNGPLVNLGFNFKRIISWIEFEMRLLYWSFFVTKDKPDVIIVSSLSLLTFLSGKILKRKFKCKLICEVRDIWPLTLIETKKVKKTNIIIRFLSYIENSGYRFADGIVGTMANLKSYIYTINPTYSEKVSYIPTGFDPDFYVKEIKVLNETGKMFSQIPKNNFIVGYAGTIGLANCVNEIIEIAYRMKGQAVSFIIFGDGVLKDQLVKKTFALKLDNVIFGGYYPKNNIPYILESCDVLIHPWLSNVSLYDYGVSPNKWIDYMFSGRPIIVALDGYKNIINEAECGVFVKAGDIDAMINAINNYRSLDKNELDRVGNNGKEYLLKYLTYDVLSDKYITIIDNLFNFQNTK